MKRLVVVPFVALLLVGCAQAGMSASPVGSFESATTQPTPAVTLAPSNPSTPVPTFVLIGDVPGPDATPPAGQPLIADLDVMTVGSTAASLGMACHSNSGSYPGAFGGYTLGCEGAIEGRVKISLSAVYVTLEDVIGVTVLVRPATFDGTITDPTIAPRILLAVAQLVARPGAFDWMQSEMNDPACGKGCDRDFLDVTINVGVGVDGSRTLDLTPSAMP